MNYIWEALIKAKNDGISLDKIDFEFASSYSPYMELSHSFLNNRVIEREMELNPYYRFYNIFKDLFAADYHDDQELREVAFDLLVHYLGQLDLLQGLDRIEYYKLFIYRELKNGNFGSELADILSYFSIKEKNILLKNLLKLYVTGDHIYYFKDNVKKIYKGSIVYINRKDINEILVYIRQEDNLKNLKIMEGLKKLFLPLNFTVRIYWKFHFGIIDVDETMKIDKIAIY